MKYTKYSIPLGAIAGLAISVTTSQAAITYVDAQAGSGGNTRDSTKPQNDVTWIHAGTGADSDQWAERSSPFGTNNNIFQALPSGDPSSIPQLTTTISGLTDGQTYAVYAFFQDNTGDTSSAYQNWVLSAGLTTSLDTTYWSDGQPIAAHNAATPVVGTTGSGTISTMGVSEASTLTYAGTAPTDVLSGVGTTGERRLYAVYLGETTLSGATEIDVYVDMLIEGSTSETRTWYDGVGYEAVPEPSSTALLGLGGLSLILRRRR